jgi:prolyl oligopeptidase
MRKLLAIVLVACGGGSAKPVTSAGPIALPARSPPTAQAQSPHAHPIAKDIYHGVTVEDPYRWLEANTPEVQAWSDGQDTATRKFLAALPERDKLRDELAAIINAPITEYAELKEAGKILFALRHRPNTEQPELVRISNLGAKTEQVELVLDPTAGGNAHRTIDWFVPSPDGKLVAISLSENGSETGMLHLVDLHGEDVEAPLVDVQRGTAGGDVAWTPDGKGIFYTRYTGGDFYVQVWFHALGSPSDKDRYELGKDQPRVGEYLLETDARGRLLVQIQNGDGGMYRHYLREASGTWRQLADWDDRVKFVTFASTGDLWLVSTKDAPRGKVMKLGAKATLAQAKVVVPEGKDAIITNHGDEALIEVGGRVYVRYQTGGPTELRVFTPAGKSTKPLELPAIASIKQPVRWRDGVLVGVTTYTSPLAYYRVAPKAFARIESISPRPPVDLSKVEVRRELATSKDGTKVPINIIWPAKAAKDGSTPCIVYGYGGFGISLTPSFAAWMAPLLQRGVCYAVVNLRGGAEFGEDWHRAGRLTAKQNVFDDFAAALAYVVDEKYTTRDRLGILGGSNGGLLMGAMLTQHPDMMKAVVSEVGIYDMLRVELTPNGEFNITEYGTVKDEAQFKALYAYSPLHHVVKGTAYPATLFTTGANDPRVEPWHSRKMLAALQAAQGRPAPLLLRVSKEAGHGMGTNRTEEIELSADVQAFLLAQLKQ